MTFACVRVCPCGSVLEVSVEVDYISFVTAAKIRASMAKKLMKAHRMGCGLALNHKA